MCGVGCAPLINIFLVIFNDTCFICWRKTHSGVRSCKSSQTPATERLLAIKKQNKKELCFNSCNQSFTFFTGIIATALAMSDQHTCILVASRRRAISEGAMCWGRNDYGQLGIGTRTDLENSPELVLLDTSESVVHWSYSTKDSLKPGSDRQLALMISQ